MTLRLVFMGSPDFSVPALHALHAAGHEIAAVYCQPPRPANRGQAVTKCPVHVAAEAMGLQVRTPVRLRRDTAAQAAYRSLDLDAGVVAAYGLILPGEMLAAPRRGCLNIHASLLPRWRGAAPIQAAILAGDSESGVTIMQMDEGLDTGAMLLREAVPITEATTASDLHDALSAMGARLILDALATPRPPVPQPEQGATYAAKLSRADGRLDFAEPADSVLRRVRALNPWPGTFCMVDGQTLKILAAERTGGCGSPGTVLDDRLSVACLTGAVRLTRVQRPGRAAMDAASFLRGNPVRAGTVLTA